MDLPIKFDEQNKQTLAHFFSKFFGPPVMLPAILVFLFWQTRAFSVFINWGFLVTILVLCWLTPVLFFAFSLRRGWVDDIDATERAQRYATYSLGGLGWILGLGVSRLMVNDQFWRYYAGVLTLILALVIVTFFWKVSVHAGTVTFFYLLINYFFGWFFFWLVPIPILVMWSRWHQKKHTWGQLLGGSVLAIFIFLIFTLFVVTKNTK